MQIGNRIWLLRQMLEVLRLGRVWQLGWREEFGAEASSAPPPPSKAEAGKGDEEGMEGGVHARGEEMKAQSEELKRQWWRDVVFNIGWLPVRLYASSSDTETQNPVSEVWFAVCGLVPSWIMMQDAWRASA